MRAKSYQCFLAKWKGCECVITIKMFRDDEANVWIAVCEEIGLVLESESYDDLCRKLQLSVPEMASVNGVSIDKVEIEMADKYM